MPTDGGTLATAVHTPSTQLLLWQSAFTPHPWPFAQSAGHEPPQSTSVSSWFSSPSVQLGPGAEYVRPKP
jgi:hypothetical protein